MKRILTAALVALMALGARAQYYGIVNQVANMVQTAVTGGLNYRGLFEAEYLAGVGNNKVSFLNFTTSQGFKFTNWFFMGAGLGVDVAFSSIDDDSMRDPNTSVTKTGVMIPLFTDFRFNIGPEDAPSFMAGLRLGGTFLIGSDYLQLNKGYLSSKEYFYLRPSAGMRIPLSSTDKRLAMNVQLSYQLIAGRNYYYWGYGNQGNVALSAIGAAVSFEW